MAELIVMALIAAPVLLWYWRRGDRCVYCNGLLRMHEEFGDLLLCPKAPAR